MIVLAFRSIIPSIPLEWWEIGQILRKNIFFTLPVLGISLIFHNSIHDMSIIRRHLHKDALLGLIVAACMLIPSLLYSGSFKFLAAGQLSPGQLAVVLFSGFIYNIFMAALPEELFFRAFLQRRLGAGLRSPLSGVLLSALFFGLVHSAGNTAWGYGRGFFGGLAEAVFVQAFIGLIYGVIYLRTRNVFLCIILHAFSNTVTNLAFFATKLGYTP
ncbi:MAG: CPBP family intramembrane metalloprotease [Syntrophaceae bacterium]|nr:CPBP family intramembrane metalloprotease [Syntrophaceae bacterium]